MSDNVIGYLIKSRYFYSPRSGNYGSNSHFKVNKNEGAWIAGAVFSYKLRYIVGFRLVEMTISTNQKPTIYRNLYENTGPGL